MIGEDCQSVASPKLFHISPVFCSRPHDHWEELSWCVSLWSLVSQGLSTFWVVCMKSYFFLSDDTQEIPVYQQGSTFQPSSIEVCVYVPVLCLTDCVDGGGRDHTPCIATRGWSDSTNGETWHWCVWAHDIGVWSCDIGVWAHDIGVWACDTYTYWFMYYKLVGVSLGDSNSLKTWVLNFLQAKSYISSDIHVTLILCNHKFGLV